MGGFPQGKPPFNTLLGVWGEPPVKVLHTSSNDALPLFGEEHLLTSSIFFLSPLGKGKKENTYAYITPLRGGVIYAFFLCFFLSFRKKERSKVFLCYFLFDKKKVILGFSLSKRERETVVSFWLLFLLKEKVTLLHYSMLGRASKAMRRLIIKD